MVQGIPHDSEKSWKVIWKRIVALVGLGGGGYWSFIDGTQVLKEMYLQEEF